MQATANLFETRLTFDGPRNVPKPLRPFFSGLEEGKTIRRAALSTLLRKFKGPGAYEGLWEFLARTYRALANGSVLPITASDVLEVNRMVEALKPGATAMRALVTGANGFLGRHVVGALLARGIEVRVIVRPAAQIWKHSAGRPPWRSSGAIFAPHQNFRVLLKSIDVLIHLAAVVSGVEDAQFAGTVAGTERLLEAMASSSCRRVVLCSSFSVYDYSSTRRTLDEDHHSTKCQTFTPVTATPSPNGGRSA